MVVIIKSKLKILGKEKEINSYKPEEILLTGPLRDKAVLLDKELQTQATRVNKSYSKLSTSIKKNDLEKWKWVGEQLDEILRKLKNLDKSDFDKNLFWPAIGQYLSPEIQRMSDEKRSGTNKDHYRKCWLLAKSKHTGWINTWGGWDAFVDRAEQLVETDKVMISFNRVFKHVSTSFLKTRDYQVLARLLVEHYPSAVEKPKILEIVPQGEIDQAVDEICSKYFGRKINRNDFEK